MSDRFPIIPGAEPWSAPGSGERANTGIVVAHGFTGNPTSTRAFGEALAERGFAVEVVRLPGHGTHWRDMAKTRYGDWRWQVEQALDGLHRDGKKVVLVGLSMGGTIALDLACARGKDVAAVVPINCTILDREGLLAKAAPLLEKILPVVPASAAGLVKNDIAKGGDEHAYDMVPTRAANSFLKELRRIRDGLADLAAPTVVAYSVQDHSVPTENSKKLIELLAGRDVKELPLERSYHVATLDFDVDVLLDAITELGDRVGKGS